MMRLSCFVLCCIAMSGCLKDAFFEGPDFFAEDFEAYQNFDEMFPEEDALWSFTQLTLSGNQLILDSTFSHSGEQSIKCYTVPSADGIVSKASIGKHNMAFWEGETMRASCWYYLEGTEALDWLFLMDIEEQTPIGASPGIRLALVDSCIMVEHKFLETDIYQPDNQRIAFPRNEWVNLTWEITLSTKDDGAIRLYQNGQLIIEDTSTKTLPTDLLYFQQGTKGMYSSVELGVTANSTGKNVTLWIDDMQVEVIK